MDNIVNLKTAEPEPKYKYDFEKVCDSRGNPIEGLWLRNGRYYYQTYIAGKGTRKVPLVNERHDRVKNLEEARKAIQTVKDHKRQGEQPNSQRAPKFSDYVVHYFETVKKDPKTIKKEKGNLDEWAKSLGDLRVTQIRLEHINAHTSQRLEDGIANRTVNLDVTALSNLLNLARDENWLRGQLPTEKWTRLKETKKKRDLVTNEVLDKIIAEALRQEDGKPVYAMGEMFADWLKLMACSGARRTSALSARWSDVDWNNKQFHVCRNTKYDKHIVVDFNTKLEAHLRAMHAKRDPGCDYLFPGRFETKGEKHLMNMQKTLEQIREAAGFPDFSPHDLRHQFISYCVMDGIDFMTIAKWVGHSDGGVLIGRIYGHLVSEHTKRAAAKVTLGDGKAEEPKNKEMEAMQAQLKTLTELVQKLGSPAKSA